MMPYGFYWLEENRVAGMSRPRSPEELAWLRSQGVQVIITLLPEPLPKRWIDDAGLIAVTVPIHDFEPPTAGQFDLIVEQIRKANAAGLGVAVHCAVGRGRTGTALAGYLVAQGLAPDDAIQTIRKLRPGSVETAPQENAIHEFAARSAKR